MPSGPLPRELHPAAWWVWAIGLAVAVSHSSNPLLLLIALGVVGLVVVSRRGSSPWARAFRLYLWLGLFIIVVRVFLHVLVGYKVGDHLLVSLPTVTLPSWAAGITLLGDVRLEGLLLAVVLGFRLAVMIACIGAANALANPKRLLRTLPGALHQIGSAVVVSVSVAPQLAESVQRVRRARELRGEPARGLRGLPTIALPVLEDTLDRSLMLAAAMDSRGYGRSADRPASQRRLTSTLTLGGLLLSAVGIYGVLDATTSPLLGSPALLIGLVLALAGLWTGGQGAGRTTYRPDPWRGPEWVTVGSGFAAAVAAVAAAGTAPEAMILPVEPLAWPALPLLAVVGLLLGAAPAYLTPVPPRATRRPTTTRRALVASDV